MACSYLAAGDPAINSRIWQAVMDQMAYAIKTTASPSADFHTAAREMAAVLLNSMALTIHPLTINPLTINH